MSNFWKPFFPKVSKTTIETDAEKLFDSVKKVKTDLILASAQRLRAEADAKTFLIPIEEFARMHFKKEDLESILANTDSASSCFLKNAELAEFTREQSKLGKILQSVCANGNFDQLTNEELTFLQTCTDPEVNRFANKYKNEIAVAKKFEMTELSSVSSATQDISMPTTEGKLTFR